MDRETIRLECLKIAQAQHVRTNAAPSDVIVTYASVLEVYVHNGADTVKPAVEESVTKKRPAGKAPTTDDLM